tara:strand:- start:45 stop:440 length:396 start_codon:yes stop_codon:yes gene_type:complete
MSKTSIQSIQTNLAPSPVGPYNQGILVNGWLYCSGQIALDPITGEMTEGDIEKETHQVLQNLLAVLNKAGAKTSDVVKTTIYLTDLKDFAKVNQVYSSIFKEGISPARACIEVAGLPKGAKVEIECIAWLG